MKTTTGISSNALTRVRKHFPQVNEVCDAKRTINISVNSSDGAGANKKNPESCALARACVRQKIADAAIIGIAYSWLIKGTKATRYTTSVAVGREITSFDRGSGFEAGKQYKLSKVAKSNKLGTRKNWHKFKLGSYKPKADKRTVHRTANIRLIDKAKA